MTTQERVSGKGKGFASLSAERRRELASLGGKAAHKLGKAHQFTSEEAKAAGKIGGAKSRRKPSTKTKKGA